MKAENHPIDEQEECSKPDKRKREAWLHWNNLANCEDIEDLPLSTRKYFKCVAKDFVAANLSSGTASELGLKLLEVWGLAHGRS